MISPAEFSIITDLTPTLTWTYGESGCGPAQYKVEVWSAMTYPVGASAGYFLFSETVTAEHLDWPASAAPLQPGQSYYVYITALTYRNGELTPSTDTFSHFSTGPLCSAGDSLAAPNLRWPPDGWKLDPNVGMDFEWGDSMTCWPDDNYYIEISKFTDFRDPILQDTDLPLEHMWLYPFMGLPWENCTRYYWRVRPNMLGTEDEPFSETRSFLTQPGDTTCPLDLGGSLIPPEATVSPSVRLNVDAYCRSGPTTEYKILDTLPAGTELPIQGRNRAGDSWLVEDANISKSCWVYGAWVDVVGDTGLIGIINPGPPTITLPTATTGAPQVNCAQYNSNLCGSQPSCKWEGGVCKNK